MSGDESGSRTLALNVNIRDNSKCLMHYVEYIQQG